MLTIQTQYMMYFFANLLEVKLFFKLLYLICPEYDSVKQMEKIINTIVTVLLALMSLYEAGAELFSVSYVAIQILAVSIFVILFFEEKKKWRFLL